DAASQPSNLSRPKSFPSLCKRLRDNADVLDSSQLQMIQHRRKRLERHRLVGAQVNALACWIEKLLPYFIPQLIDVVDGIILQIEFLLLIDRHNQFFFCNFAHDLSLGHVHLDTGLDNRSRYHEDDQQYQNDIDERDDIDLSH